MRTIFGNLKNLHILEQGGDFPHFQGRGVHRGPYVGQSSTLHNKIYFINWTMRSCNFYISLPKNLKFPKNSLQLKFFVCAFVQPYVFDGFSIPDRFILHSTSINRIPIQIDLLRNIYIYICVFSSVRRKSHLVYSRTGL